MNGLLIDYNFCTGCHSCEMACKVEHGFAEGEWGIKLTQQGPDQLPDGSWEYNYIPTPTDRCDLCAERVGRGACPPACTTARACACTTVRWRTWPVR